MPRIAILAALLAVPVAAAGQALPPYVPVSPVIASRSPLYAQPVLPFRDGWRTGVIADYTSATDESLAGGGRTFLLDAELLQVDLWLVRDLSPEWFVLANIPIRGAYDGFLDDFLNWYHDLIGYDVPDRNRRPINEYAWSYELGADSLSIPREGLFLGDARLGVGRRIGPLQLVATLSLPTSTAGAGWSRDVIAGSLAATARVVDNARVQLETGLTAGYTPARGEHAALQREWFVGGFGGFRWQVIGQQAIFTTFWVQSGPWDASGFTAMDNAEVTFDFGILVNPGNDWPTLQFGMTENLLPQGPAVDVGFKVGVHW